MATVGEEIPYSIDFREREEFFRYGEELCFALEMIILNRNENGATLAEIRDDFKKIFDIDCEAIWGYKCMEQYFKPMLWNSGLDINPVTSEQGCILYYMDVDAAIRKLSSDLTEGMTLILQELDIDLDSYLVKLKKTRDKTGSGSPSFSTNMSQSNSNSAKNTKPKGRRNNQPKSPKKSSVSQECTVCGHILIGDNFFLEMARIDLHRQYTKSKLKQVGQCISGQSLKRAVKNISRVINTIRHDAAVINLGSIDLLQGREVVDMIQDMFQLCQLLCDNDIFPIVTTIPPLANQLHNPSLENKRKLFNNFLEKSFDCINIEDVFYTNHNRVMFSQYQGDARRVGGTTCPLVLWSNVARQRVLKKLKRKIPQMYSQ
ncbi:uncharacterized protein LOC119081063 [Bradysia coprophila]|uniref:uncharacterized protein LOC119081063 n=1 Tax=Bradysia coprophila TaxID=38358 RepID=UPI00187DCAF6|nr:uncharacterized protein LOC119081063 [Bradysia coprophila]